MLLMLLHPEDKGGLNHAQTYIEGLSAGNAALLTWESFLRAAEAEAAMDSSLIRDLGLRYVDMSLSEDAWREVRSRNVS
ncbi:hypothetical protein E1286_05480 [Nonomuraea terrae]|uniref:Uncharacterized protein n=1 Tax=Nonomuraea terrae TaxID=2530383 RepID=A0A4R4ZBS8_9ACTN|nr:hypothetical protein E1286_05480 [Nonomuraea terrae]